MTKTTVMHFTGGAVYLSRKRQITAGRGWAVCCSGDRCYAIDRAGNHTSHENEVTCPRCLDIMSRRIDPGPLGRAMGVPRRGDPRTAEDKA